MPQLTDEELESRIDAQIENAQLIKTKKGLSLEWAVAGMIGIAALLAGIIADIKSDLRLNKSEIEKLKEYKLDEKEQRYRIENGIIDVKKEVQKMREDLIRVETLRGISGDTNSKGF